MKKYIVRANESFIFDSFERPFISAILGPRRVGKTTLIEYYVNLSPEKKWVHLNMDVLSQRNRVAAEELGVMIEQAALQKIGGQKKLWVFIDEAQKCPQLFDQIKIIYDTHKDKNHIKFILTGSAHLNLHKLTTESLAGRVELLNLREFNLRETTLLLHQDISLSSQSVLDIIFNEKDIYQNNLKNRKFSDTEALRFDSKKSSTLLGIGADFSESKMSALVKEKTDSSVCFGIQLLNDIIMNMRPFQNILQESLQKHLVWGGLPEVIEALSESSRLKYLGDYLQTYLEKDVRAIDSIGDLNMYQNLMKISAEITGSVRDDKKIINALHCSRNTLLKYRDYLLATLQYTELFPYIKSSIKRLVKSPKGYLINNGLVSYLTGIHDLSILKSTGLIGHRFENWFLNEIQAWLDTKSENHQIYFWRTAGGAEVDFVVTLGRQIIPFEITYASQIETKKLNNLKGFMASVPEVSIGVFCYMGLLSFDKENRILFLPAWMI